MEARHGTFLINKADSWIGRSLDVYGEWAQAEIDLLSNFIEEGDIFIDCGANIGTFTVPAARLVGSSGKVVSFEPQRIISQLLNANIALNELKNVGVYNSAVGVTNNPIEVPEVIYEAEANFGGISLLDDWRSQGKVSLVPQVTLDEVFSDTCPAFIKIDVEGMETSVLKGGRETITRCNPTMYIENNCQRGSKTLITFLDSLGYTCHWHVNPHNSEVNYRKVEEKIFPENVNSINMLCYSKNNPASSQKAANLPLPEVTRIDASSGRYMLHEYNLSYAGNDGSIVLSQHGTLDSC